MNDRFGSRLTAATIHPTAIVETDAIGPGTRIWAGAHVMSNATIGADCNVGDQVFIESGASIGNGVTIKNGAMLFEGVVVEDGVFIGPGVVFTNDRYPRSPRCPDAGQRYADKSWLLKTTVCFGASIGARAVILPGLTIGRFATVAAGAVVAGDVGEHDLVVGAPARAVGRVCRCGRPLRPGRSVDVCQCDG